jgi:hypothetical protein
MSKVSYAKIKVKPTEFLALTSLTVEEFELLVAAFEKAFQDHHMAKWRLDGKPRTNRSYTTYENCPLPTAEDCLLILLLTDIYPGSVHDKRIADAHPYPLPLGSWLLQEFGFSGFSVAF